MAAKSSRSRRPPGPRPLSPREAEIAGWLGEDLTYAQIAVRLRLKHDTVRGHARAILRKLEVKSRHAAVARLLERGVFATQKGVG